MGLLEKAIVEHDLVEVKRLLEETPNLIDEVDDQGRCMALVSALAGDFAVLRYVVEYSRASMNIYDSKHRNILHYGVLSGNLDIVRYLVERVGMKPLVGDIDLVTPYDLAHEAGNQAIEEYFTAYCGAKYEDLYRNPIRTGMFPDPSIVRVGEDYYMVNSSFIFFPSIPISHSKDLVHWEIIGHAVTNPEWAALDELEGGRGFWAPDISYHDGRFYIAATYRLNDTGTVYRKQFVMSSDKPEGPYSKPAIIHEDGIDPSIFVDDDGRKYMLLNRGARIFELNRDCTEQISEAELLFYGDQKRAPEGPHLLKKDGWYYLFEAEGGTGPGHRVTVSRSKTLKGIYEPCPFNPIMRQMDEGAAIQRCGHGKPVQTQDGRWYMVYLCGRMVDGKYSILGRETALDEITWTADGWPMVNKLQGPSTQSVKPFPKTTWKPQEVPETFENGISKIWMYPRPPKEGAIRVEDGRLCISGSECDMNTTGCRSIILRRQNDFEFQASTRLTFETMEDGQNAGMTCYYDENTYLKYGVFKENDQYVLKVVEHIDEDNKNSLSVALNIDSLQDSGSGQSVAKIDLLVKTSYLKRTFYYTLKDGSIKKLGTLENVYYLCDEGLKKGKRFTGALVGMYAYAGHESLEVSYEYFKYNKEGETK